MKTKNILLLVSALLIMTSCRKEMDGSGNYKTQYRALSPFVKIESDEDFRVNLVQDDQSGIEIYAEDNMIPEIESEVLAGKLTLRFRNSRINYEHDGITITVHSAKFSGIDLQGPGSINCDQPLRGALLNVNLSGSGKMDLKIDSMDINTVLSGAGEILLSGKSSVVDHSISGAGDIRAYNLNSTYCAVRLSGSGDCEVKATNALVVNISGSGSVYYQGYPHVTAQVTGSGTVVQQ